MAIIHVSSVDYDECFRPKKLVCLDNYIEENPLLLQFIKSQCPEAVKKIAFVGSIRQSALSDIRTKTGSAFVATQYLSQHIHATFDQFTLSDVFLNQRSGYTVDNVLAAYKAAGFANGLIPTWSGVANVLSQLKGAGHEKINTYRFLDNDKINILYAQMHKIALENQEDQIVFDFFDNDINLLKNVMDFFSTCPTLMPRNVLLRPFNYLDHERKSPAPFNTGKDTVNYGIQGRGNIDKNYAKTVKHMTEIAQETVGDVVEKGYHFSKIITPEHLEKKRQAARSMSPASDANRLFSHQDKDLLSGKSARQTSDRAAERTMPDSMICCIQ